MRPVPYFSSAGATGGHYRVAQRSGEIAATVSAAAHLARIRWTDQNKKLLLHRIKVGISFSGAVTTAVEMTMRAIIVRQFTVDFSSNITNINMTATASTNQCRKQFMVASSMGTSGPGICTTAAMSGQTLTADAAPFAVCPIPTLVPSTATGTAVAIPVGAASPMVTLYEWTALGDHPIILEQNEGVVIQNHLAGPASGTFGLYVQWEWAEIFSF